MNLRRQVVTRPRRSAIAGAAVAQGRGSRSDRWPRPTSHGADLAARSPGPPSAISGAVAPGLTDAANPCSGSGPAETVIGRSTAEASRLIRP
jgi:hypothetical protein